MTALAKKFALFLTSFVALYLVVAGTLSQIHLGEHTLFQKLIPSYDLPGGIGYTLTRFREAESVREPDLLVIGSSHAFMSFDPRVFSAAGLRIFCMGSTSQTPMNSYFLLRRYLSGMQPKRVLFEIYPTVLEIEDGLESYYDLLANRPIDAETMVMAISTGTPDALNALTAEFFARKSAGSRQRQERPKNLPIRYVSGGYVESDSVFVPVPLQNKRAIRLSAKQLWFLRLGLQICRKAGVRPVLVAHPFSRTYMNSLMNYDEASSQLRALATAEGADYWDFNGEVTLRDDTDFRDETHLNAAGVRKFNAALLEKLQKSIPPTPASA